MRLMIIGSGWEQERLVRLAKDRGHQVIATAWPPTYADALGLADVGEVVDPRDLNAVWHLAQRHSIEAVVADQCDYSYFAAAWVAERLGLPGPSVAAAQVATNKHRQRQRLGTTSVPQPRHWLCADLDDVWKALSEIGYPAICKPVDNRGNFGVNRVDGPDDVREAFYEAVANAHSRGLLVEEFIEGTMTTVEGFVFPGGTHVPLAWSSKVMLGGRKRVAMELRYPGDLPGPVAERLIAINQEAMRALGYGPGPTHAEYMVTADGTPYFIEAANRGGGVLINSHIVPALTGVETTALMLDHATGRTIVPTAAAMRGGVVLSFFGFPGRGKVLEVQGMDDARAVPGVLALRLLVRPGDQLNPIVTDAHRHGFVIARAETRPAAVDAAQRAKGLVEVKLQ